MESFAIRWSMLDRGGLIAGVVLGVGFEGCKGTCFLGVGLGAVDLSPSINLFTVSDIFGWAGIDDSARRGSGILANLGAETCGVEGCCCSIAGRPLEIFGKGFLEKGACTFGRLRCRDSAILARGWLLRGTEAGLGFLNGVTSFNDGRAGAGFTAGGALTFGRVEG